jgi:hypothetical protein
MALNDHRLPYGLRDVKVATLSDAGVYGSLVDLPAGQTLEFTETTSSQELRGDDQVVANRTVVDDVEWSLAAGGISFEAMKVMAGGTIETSGSTPNVVKEWFREGGDSYPKFFIAGKALSESGGDHHTVIYNAKASQISGTHQDQEFWISNAEGTGIASINEDSQGVENGKVWSMIANETPADIAIPA